MTKKVVKKKVGKVFNLNSDGSWTEISDEEGMPVEPFSSLKKAKEYLREYLPADVELKGLTLFKETRQVVCFRKSILKKKLAIEKSYRG